MEEVVDVIIYCATNLINNKKYIGQTQRKLERRITEHISMANRNNEFAFHQALNKYGAENFEWVILCAANNQQELDEKERYWISYFNTYFDGGYNMSVGGQYEKLTDDNAEELSMMCGGKEFLVFDLDGNFIKSMYSQTKFAEKIEADVTSVNNVLRGIKPSVKRKILIFKDQFKEEKLKELIQRTILKKFAVFNLNGDFIGVWNNQVTCAKELNIISLRGSISKCLYKKLTHVRNYRFYYLDDVPNDIKYLIKEVV